MIKVWFCFLSFSKKLQWDYHAAYPTGQSVADKAGPEVTSHGQCHIRATPRARREAGREGQHTFIGKQGRMISPVFFFPVAAECSEVSLDRQIASTLNNETVNGWKRRPATFTVPKIEPDFGSLPPGLCNSPLIIHFFFPLKSSPKMNTTGQAACLPGRQVGQVLLLGETYPLHPSFPTGSSISIVVTVFCCPVLM